MWFHGSSICLSYWTTPFFISLRYARAPWNIPGCIRRRASAAKKINPSDSDRFFAGDVSLFVKTSLSFFWQEGGSIPPESAPQKAALRSGWINERNKKDPSAQVFFSWKLSCDVTQPEAPKGYSPWERAYLAYTTLLRHFLVHLMQGFPEIFHLWYLFFRFLVIDRLLDSEWRGIVLYTPF